MSLQKINDVYIDLKKISYIGLPDTHVKSHIGVTIHYLLVIIDGHPIELTAETKDEIIILRQLLLDKLSQVDMLGLLPG